LQDTSEKINYINERLKADLSAEKYLHSLGTAECAAELAKRCGLDAEKAYLAGLTHDCAKGMPEDKLKAILAENSAGQNIDFNAPKTWHAPAGAYVARTEFGIEDEEILRAIALHTVGALDMSDFDKIIFLADKIEKNTRGADWREKILKVLDLKNGLDKALLECYKATITSLVERGLAISLETIEIYNYYLQTEEGL